MNQHLIIVPTEGSGTELLRSMTRDNSKLINVSTATINRLAEEATASFRLQNDIKLLDPTCARQLMLKALERVIEHQSLEKSGFQYFKKMDVLPENASKLFEALMEVKKNTDPSKDPLSTLDSLHNNKKASDLKLVFATYENLKKETENRLRWDDADLIREAILLVNTNQAFPTIDASSKIHLPIHLQIAPLEQRCLEILAGFSVQLIDMSQIVQTITGSTCSSTNVIDANETYISHFHGFGEMNEVKGVLREIKKSRLLLEDAVVAVTDYSTYAHLFYQLSQRYGLPITFSKGLPVAVSKPGQMVLRYIHWRESGSAKDLEGFLCSPGLDREAFKQFYAERLEEKRESFLKKFQLTLPSLEETFDHHLLTDIALQTIQEPDLAKGMKQVNSFNETMLKKYRGEEPYDLPPTIVEPDAAVKHLLHGMWLFLFLQDLNEKPLTAQVVFLVEQFCLKGSGSSSHLARGKDPSWLEEIHISAARAMIDGIEKLEQVLVSHHPEKQLKHLLDNLRICRSKAKPGHLHISSWKNAWWVWRKHLFGVGFDQSRFPGRIMENPYLLDEELLQLEMTSSLERDKPFRERREFQLLMEFMQSRCQQATVSCSIYNMDKQQENKPDRRAFHISSTQKGNQFPLIYSFKSIHGGELDMTDYWMQNESPANGWHLIDPMVRLFNERHSNEFTAYDGKIEPLDEANTPKEVHFTATQLREMAECPFRHYARDILSASSRRGLGHSLQWLTKEEQEIILINMACVIDYWTSELEENPLEALTQHREEILGRMEDEIDFWMEEMQNSRPAQGSWWVVEQKKKLMEAAHYLIEEEAEHIREMKPVTRTMFPENATYRFTFDDRLGIEVSTTHNRLDVDGQGSACLIDYTLERLENKQAVEGVNIPFDKAFGALIINKKAKKKQVIKSIVQSVEMDNNGSLKQCFDHNEDNTGTLSENIDRLVFVWEDGEWVMSNDKHYCLKCLYHKACRRHQYAEGVIRSKWQHTTWASEVRQDG